MKQTKKCFTVTVLRSKEARMDATIQAISIMLTSQGVPFIHSGQEFFRTKHGVENSYKSPK